MESRISESLGFTTGSRPFQANKPTLVFIHGSSQNRLFWRSQVQSLLDVANTVAIDLPGHGTSPGLGNDHVADYVRVVMDFIDEEKIPHPIPCGLSLGGAITLQLLIDHGECFPAGILMNTGARLKVAPLIFETIQQDYNKFVESVLVSMGISGKSDADTLRPLIQESSACEPQVALGDFQACNRFDVMDSLQTIKTPVLVLTAADDVLTPAKYGRYMGEKIAGAIMHSIEDAGHLSPLEKPDEVNNAIRHFLQQLPE
ncbi:MAG: alpha/beta hydrolase [Desulfobacterales bacterium]|nr:alpha/beta hydrolase [Desulfobacterales bacterium]MDX2512434.1 alpha/beta hydrolase [Desulfobacterales bacterium]